MITKEKYLDMIAWVYNSKSRVSESDNVIFCNEFITFLENDFIRDKEIINITRSYSHGSGKYFDKWTEESFIECLNAFVKHVVSCVQNHHVFDVQHNWVIVKGLCVILENNLFSNWVNDNTIINEKYKGYYKEGDKYGFYGMPFYLYMMRHYNWLHFLRDDDKFGFDAEKEIIFDMDTWKDVYPSSGQITCLKNEYDPGWTEDDWTYNENVTLNEQENKYRNWDRETETYWDGKTPHRYYDRYMYQIRKITGCNCLRKVDIGWSFVSSAIDSYGSIVAFNGIYPIKRLKTSLGCSFYKQSGFWSDGVYCDDVNIKRIKFPVSKPVNLSLMDHERIFIVHNDKTGYWCLPKLIYPVKFIRFIKDILKKNKSIIGPWSDTIVYADSRTLNGKGAMHMSDYPDIEDIETFKKLYKKIALRKMKSHIDMLKTIGGNINIEMPDKDNWIKPLNIITQEDINKFCEPGRQDEIFVEKFS